MKAVIVFCVVLIAANTFADVHEDIKAKLLVMVGDCVLEVNAKPEDVTALKEKKVPTTPEGKCLLSCIHKKMGLQDANGKFDKAGALELVKELPQEKKDGYGDIINKCEAEIKQDGDACENAFIVAECAMKYKADMGF